MRDEEDVFAISVLDDGSRRDVTELVTVTVSDWEDAGVMTFHTDDDTDLGLSDL